MCLWSRNLKLHWSDFMGDSTTASDASVSLIPIGWNLNTSPSKLPVSSILNFCFLKQLFKKFCSQFAITNNLITKIEKHISGPVSWHTAPRPWAGAWRPSGLRVSWEHFIQFYLLPITCLLLRSQVCVVCVCSGRVCRASPPTDNVPCTIRCLLIRLHHWRSHFNAVLLLM